MDIPLPSFNGPLFGSPTRAKKRQGEAEPLAAAGSTGMTKSLDRLFGALLLIGSVLHAFGSLAHYPLGSQELVWALSGSLAGGLIAVLNLVRAGRTEDQALTWIAFAASLGWVAVALGFGFAIQSLFDPRVLWHAISALVLAGFCVRTALLAQRHPAS
jgi:hypothetical protein